jgi:ketohexokinase
VDTIGAGDTFIAGMLYGLVQFPESSLQRKLEYANELAGRKVFQQGFEGLGLKLRVSVE